MFFKVMLVGPTLLCCFACSSPSQGLKADDSPEQGPVDPAGTPTLEHSPSVAPDPTLPPMAPARGSGSSNEAGEGSGSGGGLDLDVSGGSANNGTGGSGANTSGPGSGGSSTAAGNGTGGSEAPTGPLPSPDGLIRGDAPTLDSATKAGDFEVETFTDGLRDGPDYGTQTLHVPVDAAPPFAAVAVVPGFTAPESSIRSWGPFLASHGIVTLTIGTNSPSDSPAVRADALLDALETIKAENTRSGGPLEGKVDTSRLGVMGWSMGGGGTLIVANVHPEIRAAITMAAWSPGVRFTGDQVPTLLLAGGADNVAGGQSQGFFDSIPEATPKMLFEVEGGSHSVANTPKGGGDEVGRYGLSWLKVFLESDERFRQFLLQEPSSNSEFRENLTPAP